MPQYSKTELKSLIESEIEENYERLSEFPTGEGMLAFHDADADIYYNLLQPEAMLAEEIFENLGVVSAQREEAYWIASAHFMKKRLD